MVPETRATPAAPVPSSSKSSLSRVGLRSIRALNPTAGSLLRQASRWPSIRTRPSTEQANPQRREGPVAEWPGCRRGSASVQHGEPDRGEPDAASQTLWAAGVRSPWTGESCGPRCRGRCWRERGGELWVVAGGGLLSMGLSEHNACSLRRSAPAKTGAIAAQNRCRC